MIIIVIIAIILVLIVAYVAGTYNSLVGLRNKVKDNWSQIEVVLKRRADLIPNLVETVKGYAKHEETTLKEVVEARNRAVSATSPSDVMKADGEVSAALSRLFALTESYPELKANQNFMDLQKSLEETENKIMHARQFYNDMVYNYNNKVEMFPSNIIAGIFHFKKEVFFEGTESDREVPNVTF